ncbi:glycosyl hydrolase [Trematosphaeria pertusa]|uniref:Glycosyl hydrolase n=1 Tax=Trematosphaeria pertusa TaxID=390896 RepID=A0A6A6IME1_9PLEO|nr:glycosyl hydrolase [Trematosphaeria pertusa]KAF2251258.1 glycosyl hydrolase [Trematosphaeria pertusa]
MPPNQPPFPILIFSKTSSYRHASIPTSISALRALAASTHLFTADASEDAEAAITPSSLSRYAVVVLLQCTGAFLTPAQVSALRGFVRAGGGIVGIHAAAAGMPLDAWYGALIGAQFESHPEPQMGNVLVGDDAGHWILGGSGGGGRSGWMDEWYNFKSHPRGNAGLNVLLKGDAKSFTGGTMGEDHPLSWCQEFEGGRSFYTALGHFEEAYGDKWYMDQVFRGILWAARRERDAD